MVDVFNRWFLSQQPARPPDPPEALSAERIDAGYRLYWTKTALTWGAERRAAVATALDAVIADDAFENNALERRFHVEGLDDQAHSGASLLALAVVIRALDKFEASDDNQG